MAGMVVAWKHDELPTQTRLLSTVLWLVIIHVLLLTLASTQFSSTVYTDNFQLDTDMPANHNVFYSQPVFKTGLLFEVRLTLVQHASPSGISKERREEAWEGDMPPDPVRMAVSLS